MKKRKRRTSYRVIQKHHVSYNPPKTVLLFRSEHAAITKLDRLLKSIPSDAFVDRLHTLWFELEFQFMKGKRHAYTQAEMKVMRRNNQKIRKQRRQK